MPRNSAFSRALPRGRGVGARARLPLAEDRDAEHQRACLPLLRGWAASWAPSTASPTPTYPTRRSCSGTATWRPVYTAPAAEAAATTTGSLANGARLFGSGHRPRLVRGGSFHPPSRVVRGETQDD